MECLRLVKGWEVDEKVEQPAAAAGIKWFDAKTESKPWHLLMINYSKYRISDALMGLQTHLG